MEALEFLLSQDVQQQVDGVVAHLACTSLSVERSHQLVKKAEARKVLSLASASRNCVIQAYRRQRGATLNQRIRDVAKYQKLRFMNSRALAVQKHPDMFARGRGRLWWEADISKARQQERMSCRLNVDSDVGENAPPCPTAHEDISLEPPKWKLSGYCARRQRSRAEAVHG